MDSLQKIPRWRSPKYIAWVREQPDCIDGTEPAGDPHHITGVGNLSGAGLTAPDWAAMPVTRENHGIIHNTPEIWDKQWELALRTIGRAFDEGILIVK